jgi:Domain of unknown function (DUF222)
MSSPPPWPDRPPGPSLAAELAAVDLAALSDGELIDVMAAWRRQTSWAQAGELAAVGELARRREAGAPRDSELTSAEAWLALTMSPRTADAHVEFARTLAFRLPLTRRALGRGDIDVAKARVIAQGTRAVDDAIADAVERRVLPGATEQTPSRLRAQVERAVLALDPAGAEERRKASEADRRLDCYDTGNGTAVLGGVHLPAAPAIAADNRLHAIAKAIKADGDPRTLDQLSADVFLSLLLGIHPASGLPTTKPTTKPIARSGPDDSFEAMGSPAQTGPAEAGAAANSASVAALVGAVAERIGTVHLNVPLMTLLGLNAEPGEVPGYGPLTAEIARQMAASATSPTTRWCVTVTGADGEPVHHGHPAYRPPAAMAHLVRTLRPACGFPGCARPSRACDLDHRIPHEQGGATCPCSTRCAAATIAPNRRKDGKSPSARIGSPGPSPQERPTSTSEPNGTNRLTARSPRFADSTHEDHPPIPSRGDAC